MASPAIAQAASNRAARQEAAQDFREAGGRKQPGPFARRYVTERQAEKEKNYKFGRQPGVPGQRGKSNALQKYGTEHQ